MIAPLLAVYFKRGYLCAKAGEFWNPSTDFATDGDAIQAGMDGRAVECGKARSPLATTNFGHWVGGSTLLHCLCTATAADDFHLHRDFLALGWTGA